MKYWKIDGERLVAGANSSTITNDDSDNSNDAEKKETAVSVDIWLKDKRYDRLWLPDQIAKLNYRPQILLFIQSSNGLRVKARQHHKTITDMALEAAQRRAKEYQEELIKSKEAPANAASFVLPFPQWSPKQSFLLINSMDSWRAYLSPLFWSLEPRSVHSDIEWLNSLSASENDVSIWRYFVPNWAEQYERIRPLALIYAEEAGTNWETLTYVFKTYYVLKAIQTINNPLL